jgi:hypothetical protein
MSLSVAAGPVGRASSHGGDTAAARGVAEWLCLAANPSFAIMALLAGLHSVGTVGTVCSAGPGAALTGMVPMYLLMSVFHSPPWLRLISARRKSVQ